MIRLAATAILIPAIMAGAMIAFLYCYMRSA
jgi:hypothetical protein